MEPTFPPRTFHSTPRRFFAGAALAALALCFPALPAANAASPQVPNIGTVMQDAQTARPAPPPLREDTDIVKKQDLETQGDQSGPTIAVREFKLENVEYLPEAEIQKVLEPFKGRSLTMKQLDEATKAVGELYQRKGYAAVKAYLPKQSVTDGVVVIRVLIGKYTAPTSENQSLVRDSLINASLKDSLKEGAPVRSADLERAVLLISDMPGAGMPTLNIGPGQTPGTTDVFTQVPKGKEYGGYFLADNAGSRYTGRLRYSAGAEMASPFGIADKLSVSGMTTETGGLTSYALNYGFPLTPSGLRLNLGYTHTAYELGDAFKDIDASGTADVYQGTFSYPVIRSASRNLYLNLDIAHKEMSDKYGAFDEDKHHYTTLGKLGLVHESWGSIFGKSLYTRIGGTVTYGDFTLGLAEDDARHVGGSFAYASMEFMASLTLTDNWSFALSGSGQQTFDKNLDSSEQFIVTGARGVKAYRETISGDNGYLLNGELKYKLPSIAKYEHALGGFVDNGGWNYAKTPFPSPHEGSMSDAGVGYYMSYGTFSGKVQVVQSLGKYPVGLNLESQPAVCASFMFTI
ncbi:ShlB/FhaC/HecB family hemolysin secretion/activation protein [Humidesulfovibrio idahonensis]